MRNGTKQAVRGLPGVRGHGRDRVQGASRDAGLCELAGEIRSAGVAVTLVDAARHDEQTT